MDGTIIDIKRFTVHDGPGIRSTLFLKGCGLRCAWCQNPEGLKNEVDLWYIETQCIHCGVCVSSCPIDALSIDENNHPFIQINRQRCTKCGICVTNCPTTALSFDGKTISAEDAAETLLRDIEFYQKSGGGITISGGDPLIQHGFALEILSICKTKGIHTAIETSLFGKWETLIQFLPLTDLFIVDLKLADNVNHLEYTHQSNEVIKRNYSALAHLGISLLTRIPLIPGITDTESNITALAEFMKSENPGGQVELINFNPLAINKYTLMNKSTEFFDGMVPLPPLRIEALQMILEERGLSVVKEHKRSNIGGN
jgi:pyruvate formate lyase activating enzyme